VDLLQFITHLIGVAVKLRSFGDECGFGGLDKPEYLGNPNVYKESRNEQKNKRRQTSIYNRRSSKSVQCLTTNNY